jgi:hypothetical protein
MKLNELPYHFWLDTRTDAIERQKIEYITRDFRKTLRDTNVSYCLYALTITANEKLVRNSDIWFNDDARNGLLGSIYNSFIHRLSSAIQPNYKRNTFTDKRIISWGVIEHLSRDTSDRVAPHIHATIAVHPDWENKFLTCFQRNICKEHFTMSQDFLNKNSNWVKQLTSVRLEVVFDEYKWAGYCLKQVPHHSQIDDYEKFNTGLFSHNGLSKKQITESKVNTQMRLTKNEVITDINQSHSIDAIHLSKGELAADKNKLINEFKRLINRKLRQNKDLTIAVME